MRTAANRKAGAAARCFLQQQQQDRYFLILLFPYFCGNVIFQHFQFVIFRKKEYINDFVKNLTINHK